MRIQLSGHFVYVCECLDFKYTVLKKKMGCDGGTIPKRDELVRTKKKPEQKDKESELSFKWGHCSITQEPLQTPIVACQLGRLYSKVAVLEALLDHTLLPEAYNYIKGIKDVKELNLTDNPAYKDSDKKGDAYNDNVSPYICPVIGLEMNGKYRFVYFWSCGCVISERALKAVKTKACHKCQKPFIEDDIIVLNGGEEDIELMKKKMEERQIRIKAEKKQKKQHKSSADVLSNKKEEGTPSTSTSTSSSSSSSSSSNFVGSKNHVNGVGHSQQSLSKSGIKRPTEKIEIEDPDFKKTKLDYSVAKDPRATEVFKSLFTTHKSAEKQTRAHWVTYNPFYN